MKNAIGRAAKKMSDKVTSDYDFARKVGEITRSVTRDDLMIAFLNERMEKDPDQVFRVLQLTNSMNTAKSQ